MSSSVIHLGGTLARAAALAQGDPGMAYRMRDTYRSGTDSVIVTLLSDDTFTLAYRTAGWTRTFKRPIRLDELQQGSNGLALVDLLGIPEPLCRLARERLAVNLPGGDTAQKRFLAAQKLVFADRFAGDSMDDDDVVQRPNV
jgi:hypothetical protein